MAAKALTQKDFENRFRVTPGCWIWENRKDDAGYGRFGRTLAHRASAKYYKNGYDDNLYVLHRCDNPSCVNPDHLWFGTQADNIADRVAKNRSALGEAQGSARLTEDDVRHIRHKYEDGARVSELAREYGISHTCMRKVVLRITWRHI